MGKSFFGRAISAFCIVFIPSYVKIKQNRYNVAWCSPTERLALEHYEKIKEYIMVAVELFNELHPDTPLLTKSDSKDIKENSKMVQINRETPNGVIGYSGFNLLSLNSRTINAGFSLHLIFVDKNGFCSR